MLRKSADFVLQNIKDICFPPHCICCEGQLLNSRLLICTKCLASIQFQKEPFCSRCGKMFIGREGSSHLCSSCIKKSPFFTCARSLFIYDDRIASLVHKLKYLCNTSGLDTFAKLKNNSAALQKLYDFDYIFPVPLHDKRLKKRGYNQAQLLARTFFRLEKDKIKNDVLIRTRDTPPQTGLNGAERRKNLRNAFSIRNEKKISGKSILLVDDVYTTGSTVNECARVLVKAGASRVDVLTLARVRE